MDCWHREIERARTEADVVRSTADYLALWSPEELAPITQGWREMRVENGNDVERMKGWLTEGPATGHELHELAGYIWHAAARIVEIRAS